MASRFWVGGTGNLDGSTTTHIAASSGGAGGASYPGSSDTLTLDGSSGGGTVTVTADHTLVSLAMGAFTGTFDNSVNNNNFTLTTTGVAFDCSGTGTRTVKLGSATYTISGNGATVTFSTVTNLTLISGSSTIAFTGTTGTRTFIGGWITHGALSLGASSTTASGNYQIDGYNTFASFLIAAPNVVLFEASGTNTITAALNWAGDSTNQIYVGSKLFNSFATLNVAGGSVMSYSMLRDLTFTGSTPVASNSFNALHNSNVTITGPSVGGAGSFGVVG